MTVPASSGGPEPSPGGAVSAGASPAGGLLGAGFPSACLASGTVMLAVPTAIALTALPAPGAGGSAGTGLLLGVVLAIGALAVALATVRPRSGVMAALAVLCTALALVLEPPEALGDGLCGLACLAFLLAIRLHRQARSGPVNLPEWLAAHRPLAVGAAVTTPSAIAAASVPTAWSLPVAALVGLGSVAVCALIFR
jgi:hypothetical protein